jgi:diguanylate cyclase (GGDEF)-like protein
LYDPLTGLANWHLFADQTGDALARAERAGWTTALLAVDIDEFHKVNDEFGHESGDAVLVEVARRLDTAFRPYDTVARLGDTVARLGGDEFMVLCESVPDPGAALALGQRVAVLLEPAVDVGRGPVTVTVTAAVGIALAPPGELDVEQLIARAESAMRRAKQQEGPAHTVLAHEMFETEDELGEAGRALQQALDNHELRLFYQPKVALDRDRVVGVEALLRWQHPERGMVPPLDFIGLAEATGLIVPIGAWVIEEACREAARWREAFPDRPMLVVSVNVSARQFGPALVEVVANAIAATGAHPNALCVELTESLLMEDVEGSVEILEQLAALGVELSIDDFGTGYSSLSYLKRFPLHELKVDKSFVDGLGTNANDTAIVAAVVAMAHALDLRVVAEGVETAEQLERLRILGCEQVQGYYFARPGPPEATDELVRAESNTSWHGHVPTAETYRPDRILVVDDAADVRQLARMSLAAVGFEVHEAVDGASALAMARKVVPDCVLLDLTLPDSSGLEVCRELRAEPLVAGCTILVITSHDSAADKVEAFSSGADDYIVKPFSPRDLASRVHAAMRRRGHAPPAAPIGAEQ